MKSLEEFINEAKEVIINKDNIKIYGGDHYLDRKFDRNINYDEIKLTLNKVINRLKELIVNNEFNKGDSIVVRNKNIKPYLNIVIMNAGLNNGINTLIVKTIIKKIDFKTSDNFLDIY